MQLRMIRLSNPNPENDFSNYDNQLEPRYYFDSPDLREIFDRNSDSVLTAVEEALRNYIENDDHWSEEEDMFPNRSVLTGEWYISAVTFEDEMLSVETALLGTDLGYTDDYLGLEVILLYDRAADAFSFDGINSSAL